MAANLKPPRGKFSVPFKSPGASQPVSQPTSQASCRSSIFPDDGLDDSILWYPESYTKPAMTPNQKNTKAVEKVVLKKKMQPKKPAVKPKCKRKAPVKENAMPEMPRTPKTPTKIARIIPKTPTKKSTRNLKDLPKTPDRKATPLTPRTPTFQLYGIKSPFSKSTPMISQQSTPGLTQNTLLKKLSGLKRSDNNEKQPKKQDAEVVIMDTDIQEPSEPSGVEEVPCNETEPYKTPSEIAKGNEDDMDTNLVSKSHIYEKARKYVEGQDISSGQAANPCTFEEARLYVKSQEQQRARNQEPAVQKDVYNFRLSPNSQRVQHRRNRRAAREKRIKEELLQLIARTAMDLRELRQRREKLHQRQQGMDNNGTMLRKRVSQPHLLVTSPLVQ